MRPATLRRYARRAGFRGVDILPIEHDFFRLYLLSENLKQHPHPRSARPFSPPRGEASRLDPPLPQARGERVGVRGWLSAEPVRRGPQSGEERGSVARRVRRSRQIWKTSRSCASVAMSGPGAGP